jgi:hypothetical protein
MNRFMSLRLTQFLKRSLSHALTFEGAVGLLCALSLGGTSSWAVDGSNVTQVSPAPQGGVTQSGSSAVGTVPVRRPAPSQSSIPQDTSTNEQARIYQRANENLITQTVYLEQNLAEVKDLRDKFNDPATYGDPSSDDKLNVQKVTSNFCNNPSGSDYTDTIRCMDQFREVRAQELRDLRVSLVHNDDALAKLRGELSASKKGSGSSNRAPVYQKSFKAQVFPKIPTFQDLSANDFPEVIKQGYLPQLNHEEALKFAKRLMSPPDCSQFVETTDALVDPEDEGAGTFHQIVRDEKGNPKINEKACKQAQKVYATMQGLRTSANGQVNKSNDAEPLAQQIMTAHRALLGDPSKHLPAPKSLSEAVRSTADDQKPQLCDKLDAGPRRDYCYARNYVVLFFNGEAAMQQKKSKKDKGAQLQATGAQRIPSVLKQVKGYDSETHLLNAERSPADNSKGGKEEVENLYMDPTYIDGVINSQYPSSGP